MTVQTLLLLLCFTFTVKFHHCAKFNLLKKKKKNITGDHAERNAPSHQLTTAIHVKDKKRLKKSHKGEKRSPLTGSPSVLCYPGLRLCRPAPQRRSLLRASTCSWHVALPWHLPVRSIGDPRQNSSTKACLWQVAKKRLHSQFSSLPAAWTGKHTGSNL